MPQLTYRQVRAELQKLGITLGKRDGEYRVDYIERPTRRDNPTAYFTTDLQDAYDTGRSMAKAKPQIDSIMALHDQRHVEQLAAEMRKNPPTQAEVDALQRMAQRQETAQRYNAEGHRQHLLGVLSQLQTATTEAMDAVNSQTATPWHLDQVTIFAGEYNAAYNRYLEAIKQPEIVEPTLLAAEIIQAKGRAHLTPDNRVVNNGQAVERIAHMRQPTSGFANGGATRKLPTLKQLMNRVKRNEEHCEYKGWCFHCGKFTHNSCEPDAENYECPKCKNRTCYGAEQVLIMGAYKP